jgi:predicted PurR-regulated permease PerM
VQWVRAPTAYGLHRVIVMATRLAPDDSPTVAPAAARTSAPAPGRRGADADRDRHVPSDDVDLDAAREHRALAYTAAAAVAVIFWLVRPIGLGILLGILLAFMVQPWFERLAVRIGLRWAALVTVVASGLTLAAALGGLGWLFVSRGTVLAGDLVEAVGPRGLVDHVSERAGHFTQRFGVSPEDLREHLRTLAGDAASSATRVAESIAAATASALLGLLFAMLAMHYILRRGEDLWRRVADTLPLRPSYTAALVGEFRRVGRATLLGSVLTGLIQGLFATIGFWITGVPEPVFFGAATLIASFVPVVGVLLVIVPACIGLAATGHGIGAVVEIAWGLVFVVGVSDYVIRPRLVRGEAKVSTLATFAALFGGIEVLGLEGLLIGPVLMGLAIAVLRLYSAETREHRHPTEHG